MFLPKYLGIIIDQNLSFKSHTENLVFKLKPNEVSSLGIHPVCPSRKENRISAGFFFLPLLDYSDLLFMNAPHQCLKKLDTVYHCALHFITGCGNLVHHCTLYAAAKWPSLHIQTLLIGWLLYINLNLGWFLLICVHNMSRNQNQYGQHSQYSTNVGSELNRSYTKKLLGTLPLPLGTM